MKTCTKCGKEKSEDKFIHNLDRCSDCMWEASLYVRGVPGRWCGMSREEWEAYYRAHPPPCVQKEWGEAPTI